MAPADAPERPYYRTGDAVPGPSRNLFRPIAAGVVAVAFAGALWFAWTRVHGTPESGGVPLIRADPSATKVKPDQPGGEVVTDQGRSVYTMGGDAGGKPPPEKLLPPPEQPLPKPVVPPEPAPVAAAAPAPAAPVAPPVPAATAPTPAPARPVAATPPAVSPVPPPAAPAAAGGWRVQIAATKDEASAHSEWARLQKAHPELLGALGLNVIRADLGDRGVFYRIQAGPVADAAQAQKLCGDLKAVSVGCIVVKP